MSFIFSIKSDLEITLVPSSSPFAAKLIFMYSITPFSFN